VTLSTKFNDKFNERHTYVLRKENYNIERK